MVNIHPPTYDNFLPINDFAKNILLKFLTNHCTIVPLN